MAKAWLWDSDRVMEVCIRALIRIRVSKVVLLSSGLFSFLVCRHESIAVIIGKEYANVLERTTSARRTIV